MRVLIQVGVVGVLGIVALVATFGVKKSLVSLLNLYRRVNLLWLSFRGTTASKEVEKRVVSGKAWEEYCDTLKAAGAALISSGSPTDPFNQAEGYRYLTRLVRGSLASFMECTDYNRPKFTAIANGATATPVKLGSDNPDNLYQNAILSGRKAYLLTVTRGTVNYLGFGTQSGMYGSVGGLQTVDYKESSDFAPTDATSKKKPADQIIEILIAPINYNNSKNYLRLLPDPESAMIIARQTFNDKDKEVPATLAIKKVKDWKFVNGKLVEFESKEVDSKLGLEMNDKFSKVEDMLTCEHVNEALNSSALFVAGSSMMFANWAKGFQKHVNELPLFDVEKSNKVGGDPFIRYYHSYWKLEDDECLIITALPPKKLFSWNFQVNNHWMESLDYRYFKVHVNMAIASYKEDGSVCIVLTLKNPKLAFEMNGKEVPVHNWLSTTGHNCGTMCFRWIRAEDLDNVPQPKTLVCKFNDLPNHI